MSKSGGKTSIEKISLSGKTGTEKQKTYAENLIKQTKDAVSEALKGRSARDSDGDTYYFSKEDGGAIKAAYDFTKFAVESKKTYGEVIDTLKIRGALGIVGSIKGMSAKTGKSPSEIVKELIKKYKSG